MKNILLIDDEEQIRDLIKDSIECFLSDINITTACDGLEAYALSCSTKYDLIITDHKMPFCTGLDFIKKMRQTDNPNSKSPIIVVSGFIPEIENDISDLDSLFYLDKPFKLDRLNKYCKMTLNSVNIPNSRF